MQVQLLDLFEHNPGFDNFIAINNQIISTSLQNFAAQFTHISGNSLSGKTHLLKAWVNLAQKSKKTAIYIDTNELENDLWLKDLAKQYRFIAIDNIDKLNAVKQIELFDLFNQIKLNNLNNFLLTSSTTNLEHIHNFREDLKTRILSGLNLSLKALNEEELLKLLNIYATKEGITINQAELNYLITHYTRNTGMLIKALHKIANAAVLEKRNITIPLIKQIVDQ